MDIATKRRLLSFMRRVERFANIGGLLAVSAFFIAFLPVVLLNTRPATGGDLGSHFWPLHTLLNYGFPNLTLRVWNPGNMAGEPHLVHYFPLPFLIMSVLSTVFPIGMAYNFGTLLPLLTLPFAAYVSMKGLGYSFPKPLLAASLSLFMIYNEDYSMWGGNTLSTLAGQFSHVYALNFLLLGIGALGSEIRKERFPFVSALCFAAVALSHAYVMLGVPAFLLSFVFCYPHSILKTRLRYCFLSGVFSLFLALWFVVPMIDNSPWTSAMPMRWSFKDNWHKLLPEILYPCVASLVLAIGLGFLTPILPLNQKRKLHWNSVLRAFPFWFLPIMTYVVFFLTFTQLGLVNIRALPQIYLFLCLIAAIGLGGILKASGIITSWLGSVLVLFASLWWTHQHVVKFPQWLEWNYSGWESKKLYPKLKLLSDNIRGDFSQPRVVYEHNDVNSAAGTPRVFEMLPFFANRATLESVYTQANILSPMIWYIQAEVSKTPSCPLVYVKCPKYNISNSLPRLQLMGVGDLILITSEVLEQARNTDELEEKETFGPWHLFHLKQQPNLVEVFNKKPTTIPDANWKDRFLQWFIDYTGTEAMIIRESDVSKLKTTSSVRQTEDAWTGDDDCRASVHVTFNKLRLDTTCPGKAHYLKFAYHPTWETDTGDEVFMVSPGFIALVPSKSEITLLFGQSKLWYIASVVSIISFFLLLGIFWMKRPTSNK